MSELFKIKGKFVKYEEKEISATFTLHTAIFLIDNQRADKPNPRDLEETPFQVFGKGLEIAQNMRPGQEADINFKIGGWKGFAKITAISIYPGEAKKGFEV